ncbi:protein PTHB1 isoform X2 [Acipenser ruthenus]|uniref:protein PTHB1 isoform X2 n=1 Tax=Acipenser ruthenus TaxID=7906 RepID=UPI0027413262|nr:protein PTHB1 isoform X2 [Acipenser ruthenus]
MSLFKARDWWSSSVGQDEEFDQGCLCVANIDNSATGHDKIILGSYMGFLRVYAPNPSNPGEAMNPEEQLVEVHLKDPIIQVEAGKFVSGTENLHLAVLQPRKLSVYTVSGTTGTVDHGNQYQLRLIYEHNLQRTACNMAYGPFGGVKGRDFICIQSMDGMLVFFEQESYAFGRFLPGFLLPGPLCYIARTDTFITVSSSRYVESYKYQTLAVATDADTRQESEHQKLVSGKKLAADWMLSIGEIALDLNVLSNPVAASVFVLGERNFFCIKENGQMCFMKKLEHNPSCFLPYASVCEGTSNSLIGNHNNMLLVYQDVTLQWAAQLPHVPVAIRVANFQDLKGVVVTLSSDGHLQCSYLGTDPSFFQAPKVESREINYDELDAEMKSLHKIIKEASKTQDILPLAEKEDDLTVAIHIAPNMDAISQAVSTEVEGEEVPSITVKVKIKTRLVVQNPKVAVSVQPPLTVTQDLFIIDSMGPGSVSTVTFGVFLKNSYPPAELGGAVAVSYSTPTGIPRVSQCNFSLPLRLVCIPASPLKNANYKVTIDTNKLPVNLLEIFPDFVEAFEEEQVNALGLQLIAGSRITLLASKTSQRYRIQSEAFEDLWLIIQELNTRFEKHFAKQGAKDFRCSFAGPIPLQEYFEKIDRHFELRLNSKKYQDLLSERAVQFRAIQRRLLTRFKDKTPAPLQNLDTLMDGTYRQVIALADAAEENRSALCQEFTRLRSATHLIILLIELWQNLNRDQTVILEATLLPLLQDTPQLGWEESVDAAVTHLLRTCLSKSPKDQALNLTSHLTMPKDTSKLKKHITLLCDRIGKGGRLTLSAEGSAQTPIVMPGGCAPIMEEEITELELRGVFANKRQHSKQVDEVFVMAALEREQQNILNYSTETESF